MKNIDRTMIVEQDIMDVTANKKWSQTTAEREGRANLDDDEKDPHRTAAKEGMTKMRRNMTKISKMSRKCTKISTKSADNVMELIRSLYPEEDAVKRLFSPWAIFLFFFFLTGPPILTPISCMQKF